MVVHFTGEQRRNLTKMERGTKKTHSTVLSTKHLFCQQDTRKSCMGAASHVTITNFQWFLKNVSSFFFEKATETEDVGKKKQEGCSYLHEISHNVKKVGQRAQVHVVSSAPRKLISLCSLPREG